MNATGRLWKCGREVDVDNILLHPYLELIDFVIALKYFVSTPTRVHAIVHGSIFN